MYEPHTANKPGAQLVCEHHQVIISFGAGDLLDQADEVWLPDIQYHCNNSHHPLQRTVKFILESTTVEPGEGARPILREPVRCLFFDQFESILVPEEVSSEEQSN